MVSQNYRFRPAARTIQRLIREGAIGELVSASIDCQRDMRQQLRGSNFRYHMRHPYVIDMSIHHFDLMRALTGKNVASIYARSSAGAGQPLSAAIRRSRRSSPSRAAPRSSTKAAARATAMDLLERRVGDRRRAGPDHLDRGDRGCRARRGDALPLGRRAGNRRAGSQWTAGARAGARDLPPDRHRRQTPETSARDNVNSLALVLACAASIDRGEPVDIADFIGEPI